MEKIQPNMGMLRKNHNQPTNKNKRKWQIIKRCNYGEIIKRKRVQYI